mmetsp:Transcript_57051/g.133904  ORF Transcript_57051/g.133904 Transcript_57051/m.133904 type:complete len:104 (+) Transcript_57051:193-504(+)
MDGLRETIARASWLSFTSGKDCTFATEWVVGAARLGARVNAAQTVVSWYQLPCHTIFAWISSTAKLDNIRVERPKCELMGGCRPKKRAIDWVVGGKCSLACRG